MAMTARSLDRFPLVRTQSAEEMCVALERVYAKPIVHLAARTRHVDTTLNYYPMNSIGLGNTRYGVGVRLAYPDSNVVMQTFPIRGRGDASVDHHVRPLRPGRGVVVSPRMKFGVTLAANYETLLLLIKPQALAAKLAAITGQPIAAPLKFYPIPDDGHPAARALRNNFLFLVEMVSASAGPVPQRVLAEFEELLVVMFLYAHRHNHSHLLRAAGSDVASWQVKQAEEYLEANAHRAVSLEELADVSGVSALSLYRSFRRSRGYSPREFITRLRSGRGGTRK